MKFTRNYKLRNMNIVIDSDILKIFTYIEDYISDLKEVKIEKSEVVYFVNEKDDIIIEYLNEQKKIYIDLNFLSNKLYLDFDIRQVIMLIVKDKLKIEFNKMIHAGTVSLIELENSKSCER